MDLSMHKTGSLVIGAAPYRAASMMPLIAKRFQNLYPGMHLIVREGTTAELMEGMEHGAYDLAITLLPIDQRLFQYEKVMEEELILAVPSCFNPFPAKRILERRYPAVDVKMMNGQSFVMLTDTQFMQKQLEKLVLDYDLKMSASAVVKSLEAQIEMVKAGVGMALVPSGIDRFCTTAEVTFYSFTESLPKREVVVMWRKERRLSKTVEELKTAILSIDW